MTTVVENPLRYRQDALKEIGNIGAGNAVTALSTMLNRPVQMFVPLVGVQPARRFVEQAGGDEAPAVCIYLPVSGEAPGHIAYLLPFESACRLVDCLMEQPLGTTRELQEMERSALMEVGNILTSSYLIALTELSGLFFAATPPGIAIDMASALISTAATAFSPEEESLLTIETLIEEGELHVEGHLLFIPDPGSLSRILRALQMEL